MAFFCKSISLVPNYSNQILKYQIFTMGIICLKLTGEGYSDSMKTKEQRLYPIKVRLIIASDSTLLEIS